MRPENLKSPFKWDERHIVVKDRVWYVPDQFEDFSSFTFPGWNHPHFFENENPVCLEYCSGNGEWISNRAQEYPHLNWVGIEFKFEKVRRIWSKIKNYQLNNLIAVCGEGYSVTRHYIPPASIHGIFINFPDPWPKKRHAKHRIIQVSFIEEINRILKPNGSVTLVTDDVDHSEYILKIFDHFPHFKPLYEFPHYSIDNPNYGNSYFEDLWRSKGKAIRYHTFNKFEE